MSTGKWAEKPLELPRLEKRWGIGQKVKYREEIKGDKLIKRGTVTGIYRHFLLVKTRCGYNTCFTFWEAERKLKICT